MPSSSLNGAMARSSGYCSSSTVEAPGSIEGSGLTTTIEFLPARVSVRGSKARDLMDWSMKLAILPASDAGSLAAPSRQGSWPVRCRTEAFSEIAANRSRELIWPRSSLEAKTTQPMAVGARAGTETTW